MIYFGILLFITGSILYYFDMKKFSTLKNKHNNGNQDKYWDKLVHLSRDIGMLISGIGIIIFCLLTDKC